MSGAADNVLHSTRVDWSVANRKLVDMVNHAARTKTGLPDGYWHEEHDARLKLRVAEVIAEETRSLE
jgi:hypothetical protein